jgi:hypothetical protein
MEENMKKFILVMIITIFAFIISTAGHGLGNNASSKNNYFEIIFWNYKYNDFEELEKLTYTQLISQYKPAQVLSDKYILKYYWDEQLLEIDNARYLKDTGHQSIGAGKLFSIILNNKIVYHGIVRTAQFVMKMKYDDSDYPAIITKLSSDQNKIILALKPKYFPYYDVFRNYTEKEQRKILHQEVLEYFEKCGKIVRGQINLDTLFKYKQPSILVE